MLLARQRGATVSAHRVERDALTRATAELHRQESKRDADAAEAASEYAQPIGLADRLDALDHVAARHPAVGAWSRTLMWLILLLDSAPAIGKALLVIGRPTATERAQDEAEKASASSAKAVRKAKVRAAKVAAGEEIDQARIHRKLWKREADELVARAVRTQREATERYLDEWATQTHDAVTNWVKKGRDSGGSSNGNGPYS